MGLRVLGSRHGERDADCLQHVLSLARLLLILDNHTIPPGVKLSGEKVWRLILMGLYSLWSLEGRLARWPISEAPIVLS